MKFVVRLDDACPWYNKDRWMRFEKILDELSIQPLVGVIPLYEGPMKDQNVEDEFFWETVRKWQEKGWSIALHGCHHQYNTKCGGVNPINRRSEFAGVPYETQVKLIQKGLDVFHAKGINAVSFFAPAHTFDDNTVKALVNYSCIRNISDKIALDTYIEDGVTYVPLVPGRNLPFSKINTLCYHPTLIESEQSWKNICRQLESNRERIIPYSTVCKTERKRSISDLLASKLYFVMKKLKK